MSIHIKKIHDDEYPYFRAGAEGQYSLGTIKKPNIPNVKKALNYVKKKDGHNSEVRNKLLKMLPQNEYDNYVLTLLNERDSYSDKKLFSSLSEDARTKYLEKRTAELQTRRWQPNKKVIKHLTKILGGTYKVHIDKPFYDELISRMVRLFYPYVEFLENPNEKQVIDTMNKILKVKLDEMNSSMSRNKINVLDSSDEELRKCFFLPEVKSQSKIKKSSQLPMKNLLSYVDRMKDIINEVSTEIKTDDFLKLEKPKRAKKK